MNMACRRAFQAPRSRGLNREDMLDLIQRFGDDLLRAGRCPPARGGAHRIGGDV
jgi:hypothetical protein